MVTQGRIVRHNVRCAGRMILWFALSGGIFFLVFVFFWLMTSLITGRESLDWQVGGLSLLVATSFFVVGGQLLPKRSPLDWGQMIQDPLQFPGSRISRRQDFGYGQESFGLRGLFLLGPKWFQKIKEEKGSMVSSSEVNAQSLERLRINLAARESWEELNDFKDHWDQLRELVLLGVVAIREHQSCHFFRVTLDGARRESAAQERVEKKSDESPIIEIEDRSEY